MHSTETINQFLNLRSQGWSFARIADRLHISKPTLLDWNRKHQRKLDSMKAIQRRSAEETIRVSGQHELQTLTTFYHALRRELVSRTLKDLSDDEIQALAWDVLHQINKLSRKESAPAQVPAPELGFGESSPVQPSQSQSNQIQPPLPLPVKESVKKW
jgi:hypothetical protein